MREVGFGREEPHSTCCFSVMFEDLAEEVVKSSSLLSVLNRTHISRQASPTAAGGSSKWTLVGVGRTKVPLQVVTEAKVGYQVVSCMYSAPILNFTSVFFALWLIMSYYCTRLSFFTSFSVSLLLSLTPSCSVSQTFLNSPCISLYFLYLWFISLGLGFFLPFFFFLIFF